jgi:serine O-acetyltransferase
MGSGGIRSNGGGCEMTHDGGAPTFRELIRADAEASGIGRKSPLFYLAAAIGLNKFSVVLLFRTASALHGKGRLARIASAFLTRLNAVWNSSELDPKARIGPGLHIPHPLGVGFGPITAGNNLTILQHASLGLRDRTLDFDDHANYPNVGDNVEIGPGTAILGPVRIGNGACIGANAVVLNDVPDGALAVGNPARIVDRKPKSDASARVDLITAVR